MGLDIIAFTKLKKVEKQEFDVNGELLNWENRWIPGDSMKWSEKHFKGRAEGLDADTVYEYSSHFCFRAGSYSFYGYWRDKLDEFKGDVAFEELINFADNEGVIGPIVSKKLYNDFEKYEEEAEEFSKTIEEGEWFMSRYRDWMEAFKLASDFGAVLFC